MAATDSQESVGVHSVGLRSKRTSSKEQLLTARKTHKVCNFHRADLPFGVTNFPAPKPRVSPNRRIPWPKAIIGNFASLCYIVGLGNILHFPMAFLENGGLAFLIPLILAYIFVGAPMLLLEICIGQHSALSPQKLFARATPLMAPLSGAMTIVALLRSMFYVPFLAQTLHMMVLSLHAAITADPVWRSCPANACVAVQDAADCRENWDDMERRTDYFQMKPKCQHVFDMLFNRTFPESINTAHLHYVSTYVVQERLAMDFKEFVPGPFGVIIAFVCLWIIISVINVFGHRPISFISIPFSIAPVVISLVTLIYAIVNGSALDGLMLMIGYDFSRLSSIRTWFDAVHLVVFSLSLGDGGIVQIASHNKFYMNPFFDTLLIIGTDLVMSAIGLAMFTASIGGIASYIYPHQNIFLSVMSTPLSLYGMSLTAFPELADTVSYGNIFTFLHYLNIFLLGFPSILVSMHVVTNAIQERCGFNTWRMRLAVCVCSAVLFACGSFWVLFPGGSYLARQLLACSNNIACLIAFLEIVAFLYVYGYSNLRRNIDSMIGLRGLVMNSIESAVWKYVTSSALLFAIVAYFICSLLEHRFSDYVVPLWMSLLMLLFPLIIFSSFPAFVMRKLSELRREGRSWYIFFTPIENNQYDRYQFHSIPLESDA